MNKLCNTILFILSCLFACTPATNLQNHASIDRSIPKEQIDTIIMAFNKKQYDESIKQLNKYLKEYPEETKWVNFYLGKYYEDQKNYDMAEKYYTQTAWFDYSRIDGLLGLQDIIFHKLIPREQAYKFLLEYWQKISVEVPLIISIKARVYIIKNVSPEIFPSIKERISPDIIPTSPDTWSNPNFDPFPKDEDWSVSVFRKPNDLIMMAKESFEKADLNTAISYYTNSAYGYTLDLDPIWYSRAWEPQMGETPPYDPTDEDEIWFEHNDWSPVCFNKIAECYIKKGELDNNRGAIEEYKTAIYYYHRACWGYQNLYELNLPRIKQLRQKIKELESQLKQDKPSESPK